MAGDWIKIEHTLPNKPEVFGIARRVGQCRTDVVGRLVVLWSWIDEITDSGSGLRIASEDIDAIVGTPGFADAMRDVGWLSGRDGSLQVPNFERHNGNSAKARALESEAKRLRRLSDISSDDESDTCPTKPAQNVRPQNRTEQKSSAVREIYISSDRTQNGRRTPAAGSADLKKFSREDTLAAASDVAAKLFTLLGYRGHDGAIVWKVAVAIRKGIGDVSEAKAYSAANAVSKASKRPDNPLGYFRSVLRESCPTTDELLDSIKLQGKDWGPPPSEVPRKRTGIGKDPEERGTSDLLETIARVAR